MHSKQSIRGHVLYQLYHPDGTLKDEWEGDNTITALMDAHVADQLSDQGEAAIGFMAIGTGTGQTSASTGLATSLARVALDSTTQGTGAADNDVVYVATFPAGTGTGAITEAGIMRLDDDASLMSYDDFTVRNKGAGDPLVATWTHVHGAS